MEYLFLLFLICLVVSIVILGILEYPRRLKLRRMAANCQYCDNCIHVEIDEPFRTMSSSHTCRLCPIVDLSYDRHILGVDTKIEYDYCKAIVGTRRCHWVGKES